MRKPEVTESEIIAAGRRVEARSGEVGKTALRDEAGGGNADRLHAVWLSYKAEGEKLDRQLSGLPQDAENALQSAIDAISAGVRKAVVTAHASSQSTADRRAADLVEVSSKRLLEARNEVDAKQQQIEKMQSLLQDASDQMAQLRERVGIAEQDRLEARQFRLSIEEQLREAKNDICMHDVEIRHRDQMIVDVTQERDNLRGEVAKQREQFNELAQSAAKLHLELQHCRSVVEDGKAERVLAQEENKTLRGQLADAREDAALARGELNALRRQSLDVVLPET